MKRAVLAACLVLALAASGIAGTRRDNLPQRRTNASRVTTKAAPARRASTGALEPARRGAAARIAFSRAGELRPFKDLVGRRAEPLTDEEQTANDIAKILRSPLLRHGVTGLLVADARTGAPLFAVNADAPLNPASNVKMISTATALELLGPEFRYPTRLLGREPVDGVIHGDVYLLGSHDPTLTARDMDDIATALAARGVTSIEGDIVVGADPTRDGIFRAVIPIEIVANEPGVAPRVTQPSGTEHVSVVVTATTSKKKRAKLTFKSDTTKTAGQASHIQLTIGGAIPAGRSRTYALWTRERTTTATYALRASLAASGIHVAGAMKVMELGDYVGDAVTTGALPVELARHESRTLAEIVARINKWSVNWLSDRVIMTAAALVKQQPPSMELAVEAMYGWLQRNPHLAATDVVLDTGSGLSYRTQITPAGLVSVIRSAAGYGTAAHDPTIPEAWRRSLAIARTDGTLRSRLRGLELPGRVSGKTGTLSTVIAWSGLIDVDPERPLAFSLVTNTQTPLSKARVRKAHDQVLTALVAYLTKTSNPTFTPPPPAPVLTEPPPSEVAPDGEDTEPGLDGERSLDEEAAGVVSPAPSP